MFAAALPALAWGTGAYLRTGDVFCTDQAQGDGARFTGTVVNGSATASIRISATAGGPETLVWSQTGTNLSFNKYYYAPAGTYYRGCVTITAHTANTWGHSFILGNGPSPVGDIGPNLATLSPGARACADSGLGAVRLTGAASATVTWYLNGFDQDYASVGAVFSTSGSSVDTGFVSDPDLTGLEMCVHNSSQQTVTVSYELSQA